MSQQEYSIPANLLSKGVSVAPVRGYPIHLPLHNSGTAQYHSRGDNNISSASAFRQPMPQRRYVSSCDL